MREEEIKKNFSAIQFSAESRKHVTEKMKRSLYMDDIAQRREEKKMKKRYAWIASAAAVLLSVSVYATSSLVTMWTSSSGAKVDFKTLPAKEACMKAVGYAPILKEKFENGYTFKEAVIVDNELKDEQSNRLEKFKSLDLHYTNRDNTVNLSAQKYASAIKETGRKAGEVNGVALFYTSYMNKVVPEGYVLTAEDKKAQENGDLVFSYGSDAVMQTRVKQLAWEMDGIHYRLLQFDGDLSETDMTQMAAELIR